MTDTFTSITGDNLHRLIKQSIDSGESKSFAEAEARFRGYRLQLQIDRNASQVPNHQAALLTAVALAKRVFMGGVFVSGHLESPVVVPSFAKFGSIAAAVTSLGATIGQLPDDVPTLSMSDTPLTIPSRFHMRTTYAGWRGGIVPASLSLTAQGSSAVPICASLAAGLAVSEAFRFVSGSSRTAGRMPLGLSLWNPSFTGNWLADDCTEPPLSYLPSRLWLVGLGHLGQAYLWALGLLPYATPEHLELVLQDTDRITPSTESTSILTGALDTGKLKTRCMSQWAEARGFRTSIVERTFDGSFKRQSTEPSIALCGIDNALGRAALDQVGFDFVVEAGLGRGHRNFQTIRVHTLPGTRKASDIWRADQSSDPDVVAKDAYQSLLASGSLDRCGITLLAGKAVGAPFVGTVAAALSIAEVLKFLHGGDLSLLIDVDLNALEERTVVGQSRKFNDINPGFAKVA